MSKSILSPFAHLGRRAASDDDKKDDQDKSKSKAEEKDGKKDDDEDEKSESKAKADSDDDKKDKDKGDDDKKDGKSATRKSKADEDDDETDDTSAEAKSVRARERRRIRAIMLSEAGQADPVAAAHVALDTPMPREQAIGFLTAMSVSRAAAGPAQPIPAARDGLRSRMADVPNPNVGADGGRAGGPTMAERIIAAGAKARGES